jgi:thymidylate kinase
MNKFIVFEGIDGCGKTTLSKLVAEKLGWEASKKNFICDRYIWSGLVYCLKYNTGSYDFIKEFYAHKFFPKPKITIFVDTPVEVCFERAKARTGKSPQSLETLKDLRQTYLDTQYKIEKISTVITVASIKDIEKLATSIVRKIKKMEAL